MSSSPAGRSAPHILTVNLEDYFQVEPLKGAIPQRYWSRFESRVEHNTLATLDLLDRVGAKATFFTVGWIADEMADVVAEVTRRGHEVASKGYFHRSLKDMSPDEFRADAAHSRRALERACGQTVQGYRVARGAFAESDLWALDVLAEEGFTYDASLKPKGLAFAGDPQRRIVHRHQEDERAFWEIPFSSWRVFGLSLPISGGNYIRQLPHSFMRGRVEDWTRRMDAPLVFYFHVWELDPSQPQIRAVPLAERVRQYRNLERMQERVHYYLDRYEFTSIADYLQLERQAVTHEPVAVERRPSPTVASIRRQPISIVVPCYNEDSTLKYLGNTLDRFGELYADRYDVSYIFVDDGSSDATWERLHQLFGDREDCILVRHERNRGVAAATLTGVRAARTNVVCVIDCDCSYDPEQLDEMIPLLTPDVDLVTASPYHRDGSVVNVPGWRLFLSRGLSLLYGLVLNQKLATYTACFRVYRRDAVAQLELRNENFLGIAEILASLDLQKSRIVEYPAVLEVRLFGQSKMKVLRTILGHMHLLVQTFQERRRVERLQPVETSHGSN